MKFFSQRPQAKQQSGVSHAKRGLNLRLIVFFTLLTLVLTAAVIVAWEQLLRPPYYAWVTSKYPGPENAEQRNKVEQRGEHFFISMTVDVIVVSILLTLVNREHRRLIEAHDRLAQNEKIASLGQVAAQVAHEVRNPLAGLLLYSLHLKGKVAGVLPASEIQVVDKIIDTINHLTSTTERILSFARPVSLALRQVDLNQVIADVVQLLKSQISANGIDTRLELSESRLMVMLDEAAIRAALLNLVLNAVQAMPEGGELRVSSASTDRRLGLVIADTGSGIGKDQIKRIFEPFNTTKSRGLGLGMPYARKIIEEHGGMIGVESVPGQGTRVRIEIPQGELK
ncbi:MAG: two-component system, NtrC family, sensor histidine kinase AtoS [Blastocatellia bacterium]|nr:two-component system, NtrC family, sensor histidine kinase AtoS [Blastocatellia bacterium]